MVQIISIVGRTDSGKTTLLVKVVKELKRRGYRIGTIKHDTHGFQIDYPGKDSYKHFKAGSDATMILSATKLALVKRLTQSTSLDRIVQHYFADMDLVITEGFKRADKPKIEILRGKHPDTPSCLPKDKLIALVTNKPIEQQDKKIPRFRLNETKRLTDFIERRFLWKREKKNQSR